MTGTLLYLLLVFVCWAPFAWSMLQLQEFLYSLVRGERGEEEPETPRHRWRLINTEYGYVLEEMRP